MKVLNLKPSPPENVVKSLEEHLAAAKAGNIRAFCIAYENPLGGTGYHVSLGEKSNAMTLIGRLTCCLVEMATQQLMAEQGDQEGS